MNATDKKSAPERPAVPPADVVKELAETLPTLHEADLRKGDVLLSRGIGRLSDLIVRLDNGRYSHGAVFDGEHFVQATTKGVVAWPPTILREHQWYMDVFRFHTQAGVELDRGGPTSDPVLKVAHSFIGDQYSYDELALVAVLALLRKSAALPCVDELVEILGGIGLMALRNFIRDDVLKCKKKAMFCTEVVVRSFWQASDPKGNPYGLRLDLTHRHRDTTHDASSTPQSNGSSASRFEKVITAIEHALAELDPGLVADLKASKLAASTLGSLTPIAGDRMFPAGCISPCDLQESPSLKRLGRYNDWDQ